MAFLCTTREFIRQRAANHKLFWGAQGAVVRPLDKHTSGGEKVD